MVFGKLRIHPLYKTKLIEISQILLSLLILSINMNGPDFFRTKESCGFDSKRKMRND